MLVHMFIAVHNPYNIAIESGYDAQSVINSGYIPCSIASKDNRAMFNSQHHVNEKTDNSLIYKTKFIPQILPDDPNGLLSFGYLLQNRHKITSKQ